MSREMQHSGIEWIGEIPKEWRIELIGNNIKEIKDKNEDSSEDNALQFKMGTIISKKGGDSKYNPESLTAYTKVQEGDIVINGLNLSFDFISQRVGLVREKGVITSTYLTLRTSSLLHSDFVNYLFKAYDNCKAFHGMGRGLRQILSYRELRNQKLIYPSLAEQQKIANYLDKVCGEVDEMIALQEQMIEELKAYKQSVITEAVTKGLNPDVPMKDSGIDWIGDVPEGWEIVRLKTLGGLQNGISRSGDYFGEDFEYPFISYSDVYKNIEIPYPSGRANSTIEDRTRYSVQEGDVLFTRTSETIEEIGFAATCTNTINNAVFSGFLIRFRPNSNKLFKGYSKYYFRSDIHRAYFVKEMNLVTRASLSQDLLKNLFVLIPSFSEQQSIASYLDTKCAEIDALIAIKQAKIDELKDYKKSVIYEYVTGKKEVV